MQEKCSEIYYPPEWSKQEAIWLAYPHNEESWGDKLSEIQDFYFSLISICLKYQAVNLLVLNETIKSALTLKFTALIHNSKYKLKLIVLATDDIWIRDYGPFYILKDSCKLLLNFKFNSWGEKFPPWFLDDAIPGKLANLKNLEIIDKDWVLEGGAVEFNGTDTIMTTKQCLLNPNRNSHLSQDEITLKLKQDFNVKKVIWLERGLEGDHTDGHIDDFARFIAAGTVMLCAENDARSPNYQHLLKTQAQLKQAGLKIIELPMPEPRYRDGLILPDSYANFIFLNDAIIIPSFNCEQDQQVRAIFEASFPARALEMIDCRLLLQEGGGLHCMSKQEPALV
jgi:agmatine deiminase